MATKKDLKKNIAKSREFEMQTYVIATAEMYATHREYAATLFDRTLELTSDFTDISEKAIIEDSRILRILRYCVSPSISQMKFGQLFGLSSTEPFEKKKKFSKAAAAQLAELAPKIAAFVNEHFDKDRCLWLIRRMPTAERALAVQYARSWTCSLIADQNAQTAYRNWRKKGQENRIEEALIALGFSKTDYSGDIKKLSDLSPKSYSMERRVKGRTVQKADLVIRAESERLVLVEAKAIGVELDAYKRVKECCDKAQDWATNKQLKAVVVAVIAGFLTDTNVETLEAAGVRVVWEHEIKRIGDVLAE